MAGFRHSDRKLKNPQSTRRDIRLLTFLGFRGNVRTPSFATVRCPRNRGNSSCLTAALGPFERAVSRRGGRDFLVLRLDDQPWRAGPRKGIRHIARPRPLL